MSAVHGQMSTGLAAISQSYGDVDDDETIRPDSPPTTLVRHNKYSVRLHNAFFGTQDTIIGKDAPDNSIIFSATNFDFACGFPPNKHATAKIACGSTNLKINVKKMKEIKYAFNSDISLIAILLIDSKGVKNGQSPGETLRMVMHNNSVSPTLAASMPSEVKFFDPSSAHESQRWIILKLDPKMFNLHREHFDPIFAKIRAANSPNAMQGKAMSHKQMREQLFTPSITMMTSKQAIQMLNAANRLSPQSTSIHVNPRMLNNVHINPNFNKTSLDARGVPAPKKKPSMLGTPQRTMMQVPMMGVARSTSGNIGTIILQTKGAKRVAHVPPPTQVVLVDDDTATTSATTTSLVRQVQRPTTEQTVDHSGEWAKAYGDDCVSLEGYFVESTPSSSSATPSSTCAAPTAPTYNEADAVTKRLPPHTLLFKHGVDEMLICDLAKLEEMRELNDNCIEFYMNHIKTVDQVVDKDKVHWFTTFFYSKYADEPTAAELNRVNLKTVPTTAREFLTSVNVKSERDQKSALARYNRVKSWTKKANIFDKDVIIIPIHEKDENHWYISIVFYPCRAATPGDGQPSILVLDSLGVEPARHKSVASHIRRYLALEFAHKRTDLTKALVAFNERHFPIVLPQLNVQENDFDCGVMMLMYVQRLLSMPLLDHYHKTRVQELLTMQVNKEVALKRYELIQLVMKRSAEAGGPKLVRTKQPPRHCKQDQVTAACTMTNVHENKAANDEVKPPTNGEEKPPVENGELPTKGATEEPSPISEMSGDPDVDIDGMSENGDVIAPPKPDDQGRQNETETKEEPPVEQDGKEEQMDEDSKIDVVNTPVATASLTVSPIKMSFKSTPVKTSPKTSANKTSEKSVSPAKKEASPSSSPAKSGRKSRTKSPVVAEKPIDIDQKPEVVDKSPSAPKDEFIGEESHTAYASSSETTVDSSMTQLSDKSSTLETPEPAKVEDTPEDPDVKPENKAPLLNGTATNGEASTTATKASKRPTTTAPPSRHTTRSSTGSIPTKRARIEF